MSQHTNVMGLLNLTEITEPKTETETQTDNSGYIPSCKCGSEEPSKANKLGNQLVSASLT